MPHNGVYIAEAKAATEADPFLATSSDVQVVSWSDTQIRFSGVDAGGNIFDEYWCDRPDRDSYKVGNGYRRHTEE